MKHFLSLAIITCFFIVCSNSFAISSPSTAPKKADTISFLNKKIDNYIFKGVIKKLDTGTALYTKKAIYPLSGGDFNMIIGKEVHIIGKIIKEGNVEKIEVARVQFDRK